jgi:hypothetical protein
MVGEKKGVYYERDGRWKLFVIFWGGKVGFGWVE